MVSKGGHIVITRGALYSVVFLFVLSLLLAAGNYLYSASAVRHATAAAASTMQLCLAGNEARRQQVQLWDELISLSSPPAGETAAARARRKVITREFIAYVHTVFAPRNCAAVTGPGGKP